ncbi:MAG: sigma-54-dependent Fis family transcriptional regulator [Phycisphaerales bacterium]|nr:MAG: sigma-54-dependent Fis family transcriptional regulator [Phycisphaerales bacterium]
MLMHILIATDRPGLAAKLAKLLDRRDAIFEPVHKPRAFWKDVGKRTSDLLIVSRELVDDRGLHEIHTLHETTGVPAIVVLSEEEDAGDRAHLIAAGCHAVLNTGLSARKLGAALNTILDRRREAAVGIVSVPGKPTRTEISDFVAKSQAMQALVKIVPKIARGNSSVLILGETGVGKERLAHILHTEGRRSEGPFVAVHCGALPESLMESELFGHEQGAFTGATSARRGCFELAHQGTLFLDEIGEMPLHLQSKLLRVLEDHVIRRVGSEKSISVDVRVLAATNRDLEEEVRVRQFRRDLYHRLNVVSLTIPPLRDRVKDIPELVESYIEYLGPRIGCEVSGITDEAMEALTRYAWPGNVRELINVIERAMLLCDDDKITCADLPRSITEALQSVGDQSTANALAFPDELFEKPLKDASRQILDDFERDYFTRLLQATDGHLGQAAARAQIDPRTLFDKLKLHDLDKQDFRKRK